MSETNQFPAELGRSLVDRWRTRTAGPATPDTTDGAARVNPIQLGLRLFEEIHPGTAANVLRFDAEVEGALDTDRLATALGELSRRHAVLRTTFPDGDPHTCVVAPAPGPDPDLTVVDLTSHDAETGRDTALSQADTRAAAPMNLATGPLWRVAVWHLSDGTSLLQLLAHHIVADGWSLGVFLTELTTLYEGRTPAPATPLPTVAATPSEADLAAWRERLDGAKPLSLPTDRLRPRTRRFRSAHVDLAVDTELLRRVEELAGTARMTPFMVLLSALHLTLARTAGHADITIGSPIATRERHRAPGAVGPLATMLALRTDTTGSRTVRDLLNTVRDTCLDAYSRAHVPFEALAGQAGQSGESLFDVLFVLQPQLTETRLGELPVRPRLMAPSTIRNDIELYLWQGDDGITGFLAYDTDLFAAETATHLAERFRTALTAIVTDPDRDLADVSVVSGGEWGRWRELSVSRVPASSSPVSVCGLVEAQVDRVPGAVAVRAVDGVLTFGELEVRANRLAWGLRGLGVGPGDLVGVCLPRTADLVVALLGVLKSGAGFVPVDPGYPAERVAFMLEDSGVSVVLRSLDDVPGFAGGAFSSSRPPVLGGGDDVAYVIYTSGSTGRPRVW
ncbi:condensation domain-containing protein [Streptomyces sp. NBC_00496]|uniref:condensation domain-containing protein n=1 Tax=Streptomyces sp. NBC_00496 TaxID=2903658 RepID=UPI002E16CCCE